MNSTEIIFEIKGKISIAPIHQHHVLGHLEKIMKEFAELNSIGCAMDEGITYNLSLTFDPIK